MAVTSLTLNRYFTMDLSRRKLIQSGAVIGGAMAVTDLALSPAAWAVGGQTAPPVTTLAGTLVRGTPGPGGYAPVVRLSEPHIPHRPRRTRELHTHSSRQPVTAFAHLTDVHIVDSQSPMRVEYVDRLEDKYSGSEPTLNLLQSSYRPQEMLTLQTADAMVKAVNKAKRGPGQRRTACVRHPDRRQLRQLPAQRVSLEHRHPRRQDRYARLGRPDK